MIEFPRRQPDDSTARELIERLLEAGRQLPDELSRALLEGGDEVARALIELVRDATVARRDRPEVKWSAIHAVRLLGERRQAEAVESLIEVIAVTDASEDLYSNAIFALQKIGQPALEPTLEAFYSGVGPGAGRGIAEVLSELGVRDERILEALMEVFRDDPQLGASYLASYGDPAALGALHRAFAATRIDVDNPFANHVFVELAAAIEELGDDLTRIEEMKLERARRIRRRAARALFGEETPAVPPRVEQSVSDDDGPGPDDPCWCGSGTKFRDCHGRRDSDVWRS